MDLGFGGAVGWLGGKMLRGFRDNARDRRARQAALDFARRDIAAPETLRHYLASKSQWTVEEISHRLDIGPGSTKRLHRALGYSRNSAATYELGHSRGARRRRKKWMRAEQKWASEDSGR